MDMGIAAVKIVTEAAVRIAIIIASAWVITTLLRGK